MKKEKIYITELMENPQVTYPMTYTVSSIMAKCDELKDALVSIHSFDFSGYVNPSSWFDIYKSIDNRAFVIYKERYAVSEFGGRLMYLEGNGWSSLNVTRDSFDMRFWLVEI
jgi:hypothetical protein